MSDLLLAISNAEDRLRIVEMLQADGHTVDSVDTSAAAQARIARTKPHVVLVDLAAGHDAVRLVRAVAAQTKGLPVVGIAAPGKADIAGTVLSLGAVDLVQRPVQMSDLRGAIANALEYARLAAAAQRITLSGGNSPEELLGSSPAMASALEIARKAALTRCPVLIVGEAGADFTCDLLARLIHQHSLRAPAPLVEIDCAAVMGDQVEQALLGSAAASRGNPGASREFGARQDVSRVNSEPALWRAVGATLYLKNAAALPMPVQIRLERYLMDPEPPRTDAVAIEDVRLLASTVSDLVELVERGRFRRDLYERLAVVRIEVPPLRQRAQDIPLLATFFLKEACRRNGVAVKSFSRSALTLLSHLPLKGNTRELRGLAERLAVLVPRGVILLEDVLSNVTLDSSESRVQRGGTLRDARERFEREYVLGVLKQHHGRMGPAAKELGMERTNLYRKIQQLGIKKGGSARSNRQ